MPMETGASAELDSKNVDAPAAILLRLMAVHNVQDSTKKQNHAIMVYAPLQLWVEGNTFRFLK